MRIMTHNTKAILRDVNGKPVPQYWNPSADRYESVEGHNGMLKVILVDEQGRYVHSQSLVDQISAKLDELIEAVNGNGV